MRCVAVRAAIAMRMCCIRPELADAVSPLLRLRFCRLRTQDHDQRCAGRG